MQVAINTEIELSDIKQVRKKGKKVIKNTNEYLLSKLQVNKPSNSMKTKTYLATFTNHFITHCKTITKKTTKIPKNIPVRKRDSIRKINYIICSL